MNRTQFKEAYRQARAGNLGTLACSLSGRLFQWFLTEVYDPRFPHIGDERHQMNRHSFDAMRYGGSTHAKLAEFHQARGWLHCRHKSLIRLWEEWRATR